MSVLLTCKAHYHWLVNYPISSFFTAVLRRCQSQSWTPLTQRLSLSLLYTGLTVSHPVLVDFTQSTKHLWIPTLPSVWPVEWLWMAQSGLSSPPGIRWCQTQEAPTLPRLVPSAMLGRYYVCNSSVYSQYSPTAFHSKPSTSLKPDTILSTKIFGVKEEIYSCPIWPCFLLVLVWWCLLIFVTAKHIPGCSMR